MTHSDVGESVAIHLRAFPGFFLSQLGRRFLLCLYEEILKDPSGIAFVCRQSGRVQGFVAGTTDPRGFYRRLLAGRWRRFALASVIPVVRSPLIVPRLLGAFRRPEEEPDAEGCGLLMSIGVDPQTQANGIGTMLVNEFLAECQRRGLSAVHLTTDRFENDRVNQFYSRLGFTVSRIVTTPQGRIMNDYRVEIP